jgi:hypothetical protein
MRETIVDALNHALETLLRLVIQVGDLIVAGIVAIELWLKSALAQAGLPPAIQTALLITLAVALIITALRMFGGLIRVAFVVVLLLIGISLLMPILRA